MKYINTLVALTLALLLGSSSAVAATSDEEAARQAEEKELQAQLEAEYRKAMSEAEKERMEAERSIAMAREQLERISEEQREVAREQARESAESRAAQQAEMEKMHEELNRARRQLQETQREIARVNRDVARARARERHATSFTYTVADRPVIGVILGDADDVGVTVLGVSPDGPAERAGIQQGDVIVAVGGQVLAAIEESENAREGLRLAMSDVKADEPLIISVERADETMDVTVVPEVREPLTWHTVTRFPSAPHAVVAPSAPGDPSKVVTIERIVVPELDTEEIAKQISKIRVEVDERRELLEARALAPMEGTYEFEFHDMSEMGNIALHDANVWFGLPMAQGLRLAEINDGLGEYFKTDPGVLVLKAKEDNALQLESGDVILQVGDTDVDSPAEFMRALRGFEPGDELVLDIKRSRKNKTLKTVMPDKRTSLFGPFDNETHSFSIISR